MPNLRDEDVAAIGLLDEPVRRRLYEWVIGQARPVGREEAARSVGITRALAAFHLDRLAAGGLLEAGYLRLTGRVGPGAGRPARVYWRADRDISVTLPARDYERAARAFASALEQLGDGTPPAQLRDAARTLGEQLGAGHPRRAPARRLMGALERGGYEPYRETDGTVRLRNCPFDALVDDHRPIVCGTNLAMAEGIVDGANVTELKPVLDPRPGACCVVFVPRAASTKPAPRDPARLGG
jgi:predicted ArsR family transcriptional regulator